MKKVLILILLSCTLAWLIFFKSPTKPPKKNSIDKIIPVEVAEIQRGPIELSRNFTGTLEANSQLIVTPRIDGQINNLKVDLADIVQRGQILAELDNTEQLQAVIQAQANLEIAQANLLEANNLLTITQRKLQRIDKIQQHGLSSKSQYDTIKAEQLTQQAQVAVAKAKLKYSEAMLETSKIQLAYTNITASWTAGNKQRIVAERYIDDGTVVSANTPLFHLVELNPIIAVFFVTEPDYVILHPKQTVTITTDVYPTTIFHGKIARIAPIFNNSTHQARVELSIANPKLQLKPGMFVYIKIVLEQVTNAIIIPESALTTRNNKTGIFLLTSDEKSVLWQEIQTGIQQNNQVQLIGQKLTGKVVILGQQLLDNGSNIKYIH